MMYIIVNSSEVLQIVSLAPGLVDLITRDNRTALHLAVEMNMSDIVHILIDMVCTEY